MDVGSLILTEGNLLDRSINTACHPLDSKFNNVKKNHFGFTDFGVKYTRIENETT